MWQRFTERARKIVFYAQEEAQKYGDSNVSTEHLLLGLCREPDCVACQVLERLGAPPAVLQRKLEQQLSRGEARTSQDMTLTPRAKKAIDLAYKQARNLNNNYIGTEHLLLGLIAEGEGLAGRTLAAAGVTLELTRRAVMSLQDEAGPGQSQTPARASKLPPGVLSSLPATLTVARLMGADLLALILLTSPSDALAGALGTLQQDALVLAKDLERRLFAVSPEIVTELPAPADFLDSVSSAKSVFGRIARHPNTVTHMLLLELGISAEEIVEAFPE